MFSIENLAWVTSNTPGYAVSDLPVCERGPNGGRVMWFPPYGLTFNENVSANWNQSDFIGRPEPIYTYKNTSRTGSLTWKIVVDHPSVLNVIVNKVLANETNKVRVDSILESFFAGCRKYDLYELAKKYYTIPPNDLFEIQQAITSKELTREQLEYTINTIVTQPEVSSDTGTGGSSESTLKSFEQLGFYFDNDIPKQFNKSFAELYGPYVSQKSYYNQQSPSTAQQTTSFFDGVVTPNKDRIDTLINELDKQFTNNPNGTVTITIDATTSAAATQTYNRKLASKRIDSAAIFITGNSKMTKYVSSGRLIVRAGQNFGENGQSQPLAYDDKTKTFTPKGTVTCTDKDDSQNLNKEIYTTNAMACRRAYISNITSTLKAPQPVLPPKVTTQIVGNVVTKTETVPVIEEKRVDKDNISKKVLRALLSECDYFETIKEETPMVYDSIREKLKFFQPAFHAITPEGLNSRLTFLQQCMRPGDTIPTVKTTDGQTTFDYNNATNTAFGAPPVLILRVGDFYNTKIIPKGLSLTYEDLDLNPEGIGVQPMIANVTLSFDFVGGSGLKESVDRLQNALTFNYYANTEIYDDRADATDLSYKVIDKEFINSVPSNVVPPTINQAEVNNGQNNGNTIGDLSNTVITQSGETGNISYQSFMDKFVVGTQTYFTNVVNKSKETLNQYNNAVRQQWMVERTYTQGKFYVSENDSPETILFGKPNNTEKRIDEIFTKLTSDIDDNDEGFIQFMSDESKNFSSKAIRQLKKNYIDIVKNKKGSFQNAITTISQGMVNVEQTYINDIAKINTITYPSVPNTGTDGYQQKNGNVISYVTSATTSIDTSTTGASDTLQELINDIKKVKTNIDEFNDIIWSANTFSVNNEKYTGILIFNSPYKELKVNDVFIPFSKKTNTDKSPSATFSNLIFRRVYMIISDDVIDDKKYQTFKTAMIGNILNNEAFIPKNRNTDFEKQFDAYWKEIAKPLFLDENSITKEFINDMEKNKLTPFLKYTPFPTKKRVFTYTTENANTNGQKELIKGLGATKNQNTNNKTWNDETSANVYISKAKLN
jgi:hypothetical protein